MKYTIIIILSFISLHIISQNPYAGASLPGVTIMKNPTFQQYQVQRPQFNPYNITDPMGTGDNDRVQRQNEQIMREVEEDAIRYAQRNRPQSDIQMLASKGFPSQSNQEGTASYYSAFDEINNMLEGKQPLSLGRAVFLVENAYYNNTLSYDDYQ